MNTYPKVDKIINYRKFYSEITGIKVPKGFEVHHIDLNRENNQIENLVAIPIGLHAKYHLLLPYVSQEINLRRRLLSSVDTGHAYNGFIAEKIKEFTEVHQECIKWMDFRNYLLGEYHDLHDLYSTYVKF